MKINCEYTEVRDIVNLVEHPKNFNKHPEKQIELLAKIMKFQGWRLPIIVSKQSGYIVAGHGRLLAAKKNGWEKAPISIQNFENEAQEIAHLVADNKIAELAEHDDAMMIQELQLNEELVDLDLDMLGMLDFELPEEPDQAKEEIEDDVPENVDTRCKPGDIWKLGEHRLMCGDSTNIQHVEKLMDCEKADMLLTDPPYNYGSETSCSKQNSGKEQLKEKVWDKNFDASKVVFFDLLKKDFSAYIFTSAFLFGEIFRIANDWCSFKGMLVWKKTTYNSNPIKKHPTWNVEPIVYATMGNHVFNYDKSKMKNALLEFATEHSSRFTGHPSQKPIKMLESIIENSSLNGFNILDLFGGSGSTLIACEKTNRKCFMLEIDPHYCDIILTRWENYTGKTAERIEDGSI